MGWRGVLKFSSNSAALLALLLPLTASAAVVARRTVDIRIAVMSDTHCPDGWLTTLYAGTPDTLTHEDQYDFMANWLQDWGVDALIDCGDLTISGNNADDDGVDGAPAFKTFFESRIAPGVLLPTPGNHDTRHDETPPANPSTWGKEPFSVLQDSFPNLFVAGREWYDYDLGAVKIVVLNNNMDTTVVSNGNYVQAYAQDNPPYRGINYWIARGYPIGNPNGTNPDFTGLSDVNSPQYQFFLDKLNDGGFLTVIPVMHRGVWGPTDGATIRPNAFSLRGPFSQRITNAGVDFVYTGDQHIVSVSKRYNVNGEGASATLLDTADSLGARWISTSGHYFPRNIDLTEVPANSVIFSRDGADTTIAGLGARSFVYASLLEINGDRCRMRMIRTALKPDPDDGLTMVECIVQADGTIGYIYYLNGVKG